MNTGKWSMAGCLLAGLLCLGQAQAQGMMGDAPPGYGPGMMGGQQPYGMRPGSGMGPGMGPGMGRGMHGGGMGMMDPDSLSDEQVDRMGQRMANMYRQMQAIAEARDPAQRRQLVRDHMRSMRQMMQQGGMMQPGAGMGPGSGMRPGGGMPPQPGRGMWMNPPPGGVQR